MAQLLSQSLQRVLRLLAPCSLLLELAVDLGDLGHQRVDEALLVFLTERYSISTLLRKLGAALAVGQAALQTAVRSETGLLAAGGRFGGHKMSPLVLGGQGIEQGLCGLIEVDDLQKLASHAASALLMCLLLLGTVLLKLQEVLAVLGLLAGRGVEVQADVDAESTPAGLGDLEGWVIAGAQGVLVRVEDLELDLVEPGGQSWVALGLAHVDSPALGMVVGDALGAVRVAQWGQGPGLRANDWRDQRTEQQGQGQGQGAERKAAVLMLREMRLFLTRLLAAGAGMVGGQRADRTCVGKGPM